MKHLVRKTFIGKKHACYKALDSYCFLAKNLYNATLYRHRQDYKNGIKKVGWMALIKEFAAANNPDFRALPAKVAQAIVKSVDDEYSSFFASLKAGLKARLPRYKHKTEGRYKLVFTTQAIASKEFKRGFIKLSTPSSITKSLKFKIPKGINPATIKEVAVIPYSDGFMINVTYKISDVVPKTGNRTCALDLGLTNLVAAASNTDMKPFLISGGAIKSINHYRNRKLAKLQSKLSTSTNEGEKKALKAAINKLNRKRNFKINDFLHRASNKLVHHLDANNISNIVVGYSPGWKQGINLGRRNNQNFSYVPHKRFVELITYKAALKGINVTTREESYTSKCSFLDNESIEKHEVYKGRRAKRGLFVSSTGAEINADINAAYNILRKSIGMFNYCPIQVCSYPSTLAISFS